MTDDRHVVVVDTETTGLRRKDRAIEVAWWDLTTDERGSFIPRHDTDWVLRKATPVALEINHYRERILNAEQDWDDIEVNRMHKALVGNVILGCNVRFDVQMLRHEFRYLDLVEEPWYYHLGELSSFAAGIFRQKISEPLGLAKLCEKLGVQPGDHTAAGDVTATGQCYKKLLDWPWSVMM